MSRKLSRKLRSKPPACPLVRPSCIQPGQIDESLQVASDYCGSCYGATGAMGVHGAVGKCCNTCKEVADAYTAMGWALHDIRRTAEQVSPMLHDSRS